MKWAWALLVLIALLATACRFYGLGEAPPGFHVDEAAVSAQVLCLKQSGRNLDGVAWPLLTPILMGGYSSFAWQAPAAAWSALAGDSVTAMRSFAAACGAFTVLGIFCLALWATRSVRVAAGSAAALAISPWAFQFSRIAWDPAIAPLYLTWGIAFVFLWLREAPAAGRWQRWPWAVLAAILLFLACLSYAPARVQVLLLLAFLGWWKRAQLRRRAPEALLFLALFLALGAPLWWKTLGGEVQDRFEFLSVFGKFYWSQYDVENAFERYALGLPLSVWNFLKHFSPDFLLFTGDENLRHSSQIAGQWSWFDAVAIAGLALLLLRLRRKPDRWILFLAFGYAAGVVPAALTWEALPHALRSLGAVPFLALLAGTAIEALRTGLRAGDRWVPAAAAGIALAFVVFFAREYFGEYAQRAAVAFDVPQVEAIKQYEAAKRLADVRTISAYPSMALSYFELRSGAVSCAGRAP